MDEDINTRDAILHNALLKYAVAQKFFFFVPECSYSYSLFFNESNNFEDFNNYGEEELCDIFITNILPHIMMYSEEEFQTTQLIESLKLNDNYMQTATGFVLKDKANRLDNFFKPICGTNYLVAKPSSDSYIPLVNQQQQDDDAGEKTNDGGDDVPKDTHTLLVPYEMHYRPGAELNMHGDNVKLLSAIFCRDSEFVLGVLLKTDAIHELLIAQKDIYETCGKLSGICENAEAIWTKSVLAYKLHKATMELYELKMKYEDM